MIGMVLPSLLAPSPVGAWVARKPFLLLRAVRAYVHSPQYLRRYCWAALLLCLRAAFEPSQWSYRGLARYLRGVLAGCGLGLAGAGPCLRNNKMLHYCTTTCPMCEMELIEMSPCCTGVHVSCLCAAL